MKPIISKIISQFQTTFVPDRCIQDNIIIAHEILDTMKKKKAREGDIVVQIDMSKEFDRIEWTFVIDISDRWCQIIFHCISTSAISLLLNGAPCKPFTPTRGLQQGDSLSLYIFIICMDALSRLFMQAESRKLIHGVKPARGGPSVSHLFFADDILLFLKAKTSEIKHAHDILIRFINASGQVSCESHKK